MFNNFFLRSTLKAELTINSSFFYKSIKYKESKNIKVQFVTKLIYLMLRIYCYILHNLYNIWFVTYISPHKCTHMHICMLLYLVIPLHATLFCCSPSTRAMFWCNTLFFIANCYMLCDIAILKPLHNVKIDYLWGDKEQLLAPRRSSLTLT